MIARQTWEHLPALRSLSPTKQMVPGHRGTKRSSNLWAFIIEIVSQNILFFVLSKTGVHGYSNTQGFVKLCKLACKQAYGRPMLGCQPLAGTAALRAPQRPFGPILKICNCSGNWIEMQDFIAYLYKLHGPNFFEGLRACTASGTQRQRPRLPSPLLP